MQGLIIHYISDLHGNRPELKGGNILILGGDHLASDGVRELGRFVKWLHRICDRYDHIIYIGGNHDNKLQRYYPEGYGPKFEREGLDNPKNLHYLCDSGIELEGLYFYGSPHTTLFPRQNPHCMAFSCSEYELRDKFSKIPDKVDVLVTHSPPYSVLDRNIRGQNCGSHSLMQRVGDVRPQLHVFGHIHEDGAKKQNISGIQFINSSYVNENYKKHPDFPFV